MRRTDVGPSGHHLGMDRVSRISFALSQMSPGPWEADVDDPETDPHWTGKFYTGDRGARGTSWCTYDDADPDTLPNVRGIAVLMSEVPALLAEVEDLRRGAHQATLDREEVKLLRDELRETCDRVRAAWRDACERLGAMPDDTLPEAAARAMSDIAALRAERDAWKELVLAHERYGANAASKNSTSI